MPRPAQCRWTHTYLAADAYQRHQPSPRTLSAFEGAGPAPVTLGPEVLDALHLGVEFLLVPRPGQCGGMIGKVTLVHEAGPAAAALAASFQAAISAADSEQAGLLAEEEVARRAATAANTSVR